MGVRVGKLGQTLTVRSQGEELPADCNLEEGRHNQADHLQQQQPGGEAINTYLVNVNITVYLVKQIYIKLDLHL